MPFTKEDVEILAFRRYKSGETYEKSIWYLAELCVTINKNVTNGYDIKPLETDNLIFLIRPDVNGEIIKPSEEEIREVAEIIYYENPPKSQIDWFIAEKTLLLDEIKKIINGKKEN
ncbi:MAG: hypothetical protein EU539_05635 [Promethearchaeota archaeon]|nr:MAG: hypothetical protein EU539_05635 [Candidatus Lokiarchaeota archaeon]